MPEAAPVEAAAFRAELEAKCESLGKSNYYELLGVARNTSTDDIQNAFLGLVKTWHPDRLRPELSELRPKVEHVFTRIAEAHQTLSDESQRKKYDELLGQGGGSVEEQEHVQAIIRAVTAYQKAEVYLKKHAVAEAEAEAKKAIDNDPEQADYLALYAWILSQRDPPTHPLLEIIEMMDRAVAGSQNSVRNRFYRGQLLKRAGEDQRALADFRWVVHTDPKHVDARRELRIYGMRGSLRPQSPEAVRAKASTAPKHHGSPAGKGLFGKLFKR
jgi:curved DNA-binding protein CbpA